MKVEGKGTGRISDEAAKEAARRAAAESARRAAEAARKRAAEAAAKKAAEAAQKKASENAGRHTGRLNKEAKTMNLGKAPWEKANKLHAIAATGVAALTGATAYKGVKDLISVKKKTDEVKETVAKLRDALQGGTGELKGGGGASRLGKVIGKTDGAMKIVGGVKSALNLKNSIGALRDGATKEELIQASRDVLGTVRGADAAVKMAGKGSILGKFNPVVAVAAATTDIAARANAMKNWKTMPTKDKIANVAGMASSVADIVAATTPPPVKFAAMGVSAGLSLVSLGAENFDKIKAGAKKVAAVADRAVDNVREKAGKAVDSVKDFGKKVFGGL